MKTVMCLHNAGYANFPFYKIVIMGQKKNRLGKYIELLGYWIPQARKSRDRSIILNKKRINYWIAMGAEPSKKVKRFLSFIDYHPAVLHPLGRNTHYPKSIIAPMRYNPKHEIFHNLTAGMKKHFNKIRTIEEDNKLLKEYYLMEERHNRSMFDQGKIKNLEDIQLFIQQQEYDRIVNNKEQPNDINSRSHLFYQIKYAYEKHQESSFANHAVLETIHRKLNQIAEQGILDESEYQREILKMVPDNVKIEELSNEKQLQHLKNKRLEELLILRKEKIEGFSKMLQGISKQEYTKYLMEHKDLELEQAIGTVEQEFEDAKLTHQIPTRQDALEWGIREKYSNITTIESLFKPIDENDNDEVIEYIPVSNSIHSFPDLAHYNPNEYYDLDKNPKGLTPQIEEQFNYDRAYELGRISENMKYENVRNMRLKKKYKPVAGRILKMKIQYSTINSNRSSDLLLNTEQYNIDIVMKIIKDIKL